MSADPRQFKVVRTHGRKDILFSLARVPESDRLYCGSAHGDRIASRALTD